ncbi:hypothetical protein VARIO8X_20164 [Burkholderiales bacterium 8X]|nr:hypothetical protein VARIO8X_20164 [Burkholderiales bacterium 8X]
MIRFEELPDLVTQPDDLTSILSNFQLFRQRIDDRIKIHADRSN